jgi:hypothetical protein
MLGPDSDWVKNVEAAHGDAIIRQGRSYRVHLLPVPPEERSPILREYVRIARSGRRHFPLSVDAPLSDFTAIAAQYPVYQIGAPTPVKNNVPAAPPEKLGSKPAKSETQLLAVSAEW